MNTSAAEEIRELNAVVEEEQFVTFYLADEVYGVSVLLVHEIIAITDITHVPNSPYSMKGVINMRGAVIPVVDMRLRFHFPEKEYDSLTVIIIVECNNKAVGMIVDSVSDVLSIPVDDIKTADKISANINGEYITSVAKTDDKLIIVLNTDKLISVSNNEARVNEEMLA